MIHPRSPLGSSRIVPLLVIAAFCFGLTGCYTQLQLSSPSSETTRPQESADAEAAFHLNWTNACYGARYGLARYYGSLCYSSITGRPWYAWLSDYSYSVYSPWNRLGDRTPTFLSYTPFAIIPGWTPTPPSRATVSADAYKRSAASRRARTDRGDANRIGRAGDRSVRRDTRRPSSRTRRAARGERRTDRSDAALPRDSVRVSRAVPAEQPLSSPEEVVATRLDRVDTSTMERRAQRLRRSVARSLSAPQPVSLNQPEARALLRRLVQQNESGALSAREQAQVLSRLQRMNASGDRASFEMQDLPERVRKKMRDIDYTAPNRRKVDRATHRRAPDRDWGDDSDTRSSRADQIETDRDQSSPSRRTPRRESSSSEDSGS